MTESETTDVICRNADRIVTNKNVRCFLVLSLTPKPWWSSYIFPGRTEENLQLTSCHVTLSKHS